MSRTIVALLFALVLVGTAAAQPTSSPLRVAVVGLVHGHVEGFFQHNLHRSDVEVVGISDPSQPLFARYAKQFNLDSKLYYSSLDGMLDKTHPQAVLVYTSTYDHRAVVETCARRGVHVMMEKPLAVSYADAQAIATAAQRGKIQVLVNYETTWYRSDHAVYNLDQRAAFGGIRKIVVHDGHRGPKEIGVQPEFLAWLTDPKLNGAGALFDFGCYGADLSTWLMKGALPQSVTAVTNTIKPDIYPKVDDEAVIVLKYPKTITIVQASWNWPFDRKDMEVYGENGYAITVARDDVRVRLAGEEEKKFTADAIAAPYDDPISELRAVILDSAKPDGLTSLETNLIVTEILDAARTSAATGKTVALPLSTAPTNPN
jgi:scyllo-inositol 2-dehydrogenase (NADP+)